MKLLPEFPGDDGSQQELTGDGREGSGQEMAGKGPDRRWQGRVWTGDIRKRCQNRWVLIPLENCIKISLENMQCSCSVQSGNTAITLSIYLQCTCSVPAPDTGSRPQCIDDAKAVEYKGEEKTENEGEREESNN